MFILKSISSQHFVSFQTCAQKVTELIGVLHPISLLDIVTVTRLERHVAWLVARPKLGLQVHIDQLVFSDY